MLVLVVGRNIYAMQRLSNDLLIHGGYGPGFLRRPMPNRFSLIDLHTIREQTPSVLPAELLDQRKRVLRGVAPNKLDSINQSATCISQLKPTRETTPT